MMGHQGLQRAQTSQLREGSSQILLRALALMRFLRFARHLSDPLGLASLAVTRPFWDQQQSICNASPAANLVLHKRQ